MLGCVLLLVWVDNCLFVCFCLKCFYIGVFDLSFLVFMSKSQKHIKSRKSEKFDRLRWVLSQNTFYLILLYKWPCAFTSVACSLCTPYLYGRNLDIYVTIVNRSSNLSWMISQWYCWSWDMRRLMLIYLPTHLFYCFCLKSSPNEKRYWPAKACHIY